MYICQEPCALEIPFILSLTCLYVLVMEKGEINGGALYSGHKCRQGEGPAGGGQEAAGLSACISSTLWNSRKHHHLRSEISILDEDEAEKA